jgi:hypothetical protein
MPVDEMPVNEMTVNKLTVDKMIVNEMTVDEMTVDEITFLFSLVDIATNFVEDGLMFGHKSVNKSASSDQVCY